MARIIPGPIVADATGRIGEVVFAHLLGTPYVRRVQKPYISNSPAQALNRSQFGLYASTFGVSGWHIGRDFSVVAYRCNRVPHTILISAALYTLRTGVSQTFFPRSNALPPLSALSAQDLGATLGISAGLNTSPYNVVNHVLVIQDDGAHVLAQQSVAPGNPIDYFLTYADDFTGPPLLVFSFNVTLSIGPPFPLTVALWSLGTTFRLP